MTKKDFILIASVLAPLVYHYAGSKVPRIAALNFADALATTNPLFDRA